MIIKVCTHSKYKLHKILRVGDVAALFSREKKRIQLVRKCVACGQFCSIASKRRANQILKRLAEPPA